MIVLLKQMFIDLDLINKCRLDVRMYDLRDLDLYTRQFDAHQLGRQSLQCVWTSSLELFADRPQTAGLVIYSRFKHSFKT